jgi:hypothetical protein
LTKTEHTKMTKKLEEVKKHKKQTIVTDKKYLNRNSPPYPANEYCGKTKKGNNGKMYTSTPDKNNVCRWKLKN